MMSFIEYAPYYNLIYRDKDYEGETQFIHELFQTYSPAIHSIMDLGCGTGNHAFLLAEKGYELHGVDLSHNMIQQTADHLSKLPITLKSRLEFSQGDIRDVRINRQFDAVVSLFHVLSYQTANDDIKAVFSTVKTHLKPNGLFIFDCWYGPAVLTDRPAVRIKRLEDENIIITRIAEPKLYPNDNLVDINYQFFIKNKNTGSVEEFQENHLMRYFFKPELDLLFTEFQFRPIGFYEWMTNRKPGFDSWGVYFILKG